MNSQKKVPSTSPKKKNTAQKKNRNRDSQDSVKNNNRKKTKKQVTKKVKKPPIVRKVGLLIWDVVFYLFLLIIIVGAIFFNFNDSPDKSFFGYRFMTVLTNSMAPNPEKPEFKDGFTSGAIIVIKQEDPKTIKKGDIITFYPVKGNTDAYLTHRVIKKMDEMDGEKGTFLQTQGDANTGEDIPIDASQVVGKVLFSIPAIGNFLDFVRNNLVIVSTFLSLLFGFFMMLKYYLNIKPEKKKRKRSSKKKRPNQRKKASSY